MKCALYLGAVYSGIEHPFSYPNEMNILVSLSYGVRDK